MAELEGQEGHDINLLDEDSIPNENQDHDCFSCEKPFTGVYCHHCGQKNDNYRRSLFSLLVELGGTLTALEGRMWRTWGALLFKPGKVSREFADGARTKWSSPIRTYLAMSLILFGFLTISQTHILSFDANVKPKDGVTKSRDNLTADDLDFQFALHMLERQSAIDVRNETRDFELIKRKMLTEDGGLRFDFDLDDDDDADDKTRSDSNRQANSETERNDSTFKADQDVINDAPKDAETPPHTTRIQANGRTITVDDNGQLIVDGQPVEGQRVSNFIFEFMQNPAVVTNSFRIWLPRLLFFMMPLTMFIGAMFIRGRSNAMLYDHIIHAAYIHSVLFFLLFIGIILSYVVPGETVAKIGFIALLIYLPLSLKRMFNRGWIKTIWTAYGVGLIYSIILMTGLMAILVRTLSDITS